MKYTKKRHKIHLLADISSSEKTINDFNEKAKIPDELAKLFPSRRQWYRPRLEERKQFSDSQKLNEFALLKTISTTHIRAKDQYLEAPDWYVNLAAFIKNIHSRINVPDSSQIKKPIIKAIKKENTKLCKECRPISLYDFEDRIIISLTAKYFTELFDDIFLDSSYAFRAVKKIGKTKIVKTHHDTINKIIDYQKERKEKTIYAAECDIQKFFDCVNHDLVLNLLKEYSAEHNISLNENALTIFKQYLNSYSFSNLVFPLNDSDYFKNNNLEGAKFKWVLNELRNEYYTNSENHPNLENLRIGVPQGGALSCFISNLLLHAVDKMVEDPNDNELLYLRFCDDMILLHTDKQKCQNALERYEKEIKKLNLLIHTPQEINVYSKTFWLKTKSKSPYCWASKKDVKSNVPWLAFVGYQIKYDGSIRIRKRSFQKELKKQNDECSQILKALNRYRKHTNLNEISKKSRRQQLFALENRLISMSVGRVRLYEKDKAQNLCWTNGFKALNSNQTSMKQLKLLDKSRTKHLYEVKKMLKELTRPTDNPDKNVSRKKIFFGAPYSYYYFIHKQNMELPNFGLPE
jgi:hypothetical protein